MGEVAKPDYLSLVNKGGSGFDVSELVTAIVASEIEPKRAIQTTKQEKTENAISGIGFLNSQVALTQKNFNTIASDTFFNISSTNETKSAASLEALELEKQRLELEAKKLEIEEQKARMEAEMARLRAEAEQNAEKIRHILLNSNDEKVPEIAELLLFFSARSFHVSNTIIPALQNGKSVICDRFNDATIAYQGNGRGFDISQINMLSSWVLTDLKPDITILLDAPADIGMQRTMNRGYSDRMESEDISFYERVRKGYLNLANEEPNRFRVIDATQSLQEVQADIKSHLDSLFQIA